MESVTETPLDERTVVPVDHRSGPEWTAAPLRPVAHWVVMPGPGGERPQMVWETPDPLPPNHPA